MTKAELMKALESIEDNEEIAFLYTRSDRDGWPEECLARVDEVISMKTYNIREIHRDIDTWKTWLNLELKYIERIKSEMMEDNKPTKAAEKRNEKRKLDLDKSNKAANSYRGLIAELVKKLES